MIVKVRNRARENFTIIANATIRDKRLSFKALGLLVELLTNCETWTVVKDACERDSDGERAIASAFKELEACGYAHLHNFGDKLGQRWIVGETPESLMETIADLQNSGERKDRSPTFCPSAPLQNSGERNLQNVGERNSENDTLKLSESGTCKDEPERHRILSSQKKNIKKNKDQLSSSERVIEDSQIELLLSYFEKRGNVEKARSTIRKAIRVLTFETCKAHAIARKVKEQEPQWFFYYLYTDNNNKPKPEQQNEKTAQNPVNGKRPWTAEEWDKMAEEDAMRRLAERKLKREEIR